MFLTLNILHLTDWHLDARYDIGAEADCSQYLCCRPYSMIDTTGANASVPASRWGYVYCDTPADLGISMFTDMPNFINLSDVTFAIFTGDIVSHDNDDQLSQAYVEYEEKVTYETFKAWLGTIPGYATLGNHDSLPEADNTPNSIRNDGQPNAVSWNYNLLSSLWQENGWIDGATASYAATHYGSYAYTTSQGLKIISINTDFWYVDNIYNLYNFTNPDNSGLLAFLISELEASEKAGQRVSTSFNVQTQGLGHRPCVEWVRRKTTGAESDSLASHPSPIAGIFFGHTHEDQLIIYYDYLASSLNSTTGLRNRTLVDYTSPLMVGYIGPSITPLSQVGVVDAKTFSIVGAQTYFANVSASNSWTAPEWKLEYDTRTTYDPNGLWGKNNPLNATFWHNVTIQMLSNITLVELYNFLETKVGLPVIVR